MLKLPSYKYFLAVTDFLIFFSLFFISSLTTNYLKYNISNLNQLNLVSIIIFFVFSIIFVFIFQIQGLYKISVIYSKAVHLIAIFKALFIAVILLIIFSYLFKLQFVLVSRYFILSYFIYSIFILPIVRIYLLRGLIKNYYKNHRPKKDVLIYGAGDSGKLLGAKLLFEKEWGYNLIGFIDDFVPQQTVVIADKIILGNINNLKQMKARIKIDEIIISISRIDYNRLIEVFDLCNAINVPVKLSSDLFAVIHSKLSVERYSNIPVVEVSPRMGKAFKLYYKKIFDYLFASLLLIFLSPFFLIIALLIKLTSRGPVLFKQERIGLNGNPFMFYKFRSMITSQSGEEERKNEMLEFMKNGCDSDKIVNENRITKIGKFLRKTSIDELPQLFNVLKGEMSLVGPRPCLPYEYENYDEWQKKRLTVLPGLTGIWQVFGRSNVSFQNSIVLDIYYLTNMSPWLDLLLILKTIPVMLLARGGK